MHAATLLSPPRSLPCASRSPRRLAVSLSLALSLSWGCGLHEQDSRGLPQSDPPESAGLLDDAGRDFMINKPQIKSIWGSSDKDVWAVGDDGMMLHYDGAIWGRVPVPTGSDLLAVWGASDKDIWAVGDAGVVIHWDGTLWSRVTTPVPDSAALNDIWGTSGNNIWAVGDRGALIQFNGSAWGAHHLPIINNLLTVWTPSTTDGWIGGDVGLLLRWNGTTWTGVQSGNSTAFVHIRGTAANKVYAAKQNHEVLTFDGSKWAKLGAAGIHGQRLWMTADNDVWVYRASSAHHLTTAWTSFSFSYDLTALWSASPTSAWAVTSQDISRYTGTWSLNW